MEAVGALEVGGVAGSVHHRQARRRNPGGDLLGPAAGRVGGTDDDERRRGHLGEAIVERLHRSLAAVDEGRREAEGRVGPPDRSLALAGLGRLARELA